MRLHLWGLPVTAQVRAKYNGTLAEVFRETFCWLPLAHVLAGKVRYATAQRRGDLAHLLVNTRRGLQC